MKPLTIGTFRDRFDELVEELQMTWEAVGFYSPDGKIYPFGTDTKVISTVFEALAAPLIHQIATEHDYHVASSMQTIYPDFTLSPANNLPPRIAIDIKTTYRKTNANGIVQPFRYTLGSYTSFLRAPNGDKNIAHPYSEYSDHWTIGFLYSRKPGVASKVYDTKDARGLPCPYMNVEYFIQEKFKIVGLTPASGNTTNIGSFPTAEIDDLRKGIGPFASHGNELCDNFWRHFGKTAKSRKYSTIDEFIAWSARRIKRS